MLQLGVDDRVEIGLVFCRQPQIRPRRQAHFLAAELMDRPVHQVQPDLRLVAFDQHLDRVVEVAFAEQQALTAVAGERVDVRPLRPRLSVRRRSARIRRCVWLSISAEAESPSL